MMTTPTYMFRSDDGLLIGRNVFAVALFSQASYPVPLAAARKAFEFWLELVPPEKLEWARVGGNTTSYRPFTPAAIGRARAELDANKPLTYVCLRGGDDKHNPSYSFEFFGAKPGAKTPEKACGLELRFPIGYPEAHGYDRFVEWVRDLAGLYLYRSGYASPALSRGWENMEHVREGGSHIVPLAFRHPGYDLLENEAPAMRMPRLQCRGARWLTLLGPEIVEQLGGRKTISAGLVSGISTLEAGAGLLIRAGAEPEIGDVNRGQQTPLLRSVAAAIEPVTHFDDWRGLGKLFDDNRDEVLRWERRHLD